MSEGKPTVHYPYNETFDFYGEPRAGKRAQEFVDHRNRFKGGHWVLHTKEQYEASGRAQREMRHNPGADR